MTSLTRPLCLLIKGIHFLRGKTGEDTNGVKFAKALLLLGEKINWQPQLADELHKPIKRNFTWRRVITNGIGKIWCSDLVEMQQFSKWNKGCRYLLMVLDLFSKYGWIVPLKDKKGETVTETFKTIFKEGRKHLTELLEKKNNITLY